MSRKVQLAFRSPIAVNWPHDATVTVQLTSHADLPGAAGAGHAKHRDGLRNWLESLREGKPVKQILIVGPPSRQLYTSPSPDEIAAALAKAGKVNRLPKNFRLVLDPVADYDDPPDASGRHVHHSRYQCQISGDDGTRTIYIDYHHLCVPSTE